MILCSKCNNTHKRFVRGLCFPCYEREYRQKNIVKQRKYDREWKRNKYLDKSYREIVRNINKKSYNTNKDKYNLRRRKNYEKNKEYYCEEKKKYYNLMKNNFEFKQNLSRKAKQYYKTQHGRIMSLLKSQKRDSALMNVEFNLSYQDVLDILEQYKVCVYCKKSTHIGLDHIIPKCMCGKTIKDNLVRCCPRCNSKKGKKMTHDT